MDPVLTIDAETVTRGSTPDSSERIRLMDRDRAEPT
jgi:hypothetical protein